MEINKYEEMEKLEKFHWWFVYRQNILKICIKKYLSKLKRDAKILDIGCGTGGNLQLLNESFIDVMGVDNSDLAIRYCQDKNLKNILKAELPDLALVEDNSVDLILLLDVLEHIEDDNFTIAVLKSKLKKGGYLLMSVPAFSFLWTKHDEGFHHKRRYSLSEIVKKLKAQDFKIIKSSYMYFLLFPAVVLMRLFKKISKNYAEKDDFELNNSFLNSLIIKILSIETFLFQYFDYPFGSSVLILGEK